LPTGGRPAKKAALLSKKYRKLVRIITMIMTVELVQAGTGFGLASTLI
jgi:hypothetical protein